jgi:hypothetical protein
MDARIINIGPWPPGPDLPLFYTDEPARACAACRFLPAVGRRGGVFAIWCEQETCPVKPMACGRDEQQVRGVWLERNAMREDSTNA